jgi:hypothetical protein
MTAGDTAERSWWTVLKDNFDFRGLPIVSQAAKESESIKQQYAVTIPNSYIYFMELFGPGTLGGFLHFLPIQWLNTHEERLEGVLDAEGHSFLEEEESGDILIFATTDNGDLFGWKLPALRTQPEPEVMRIYYRSFEYEIYAPTFKDFMEGIVNIKSIAGCGPIPLSYLPQEIT